MATSLARASYAARVPGSRPRLPRRRLWGTLGALLALAAVAVLAFVWHVQAGTAPEIHALSDPLLPHHHAALVFGAGLNRNGTPSAVLYDRIATAVDLYRAHKVDKLLMSGDNGTDDYNEAAAMRRAAVDLGVPAADIVLDYAGFRTYDSCYRARAVFGLSDATLVSNSYHLPRALYTCAGLGLAVSGVPADRQPYSTLLWKAREVPALVLTRWWLFTDRPPRFLGPPVDIDTPQAP